VDTEAHPEADPSSAVVVTTHGLVRIVTLNRPEVLNAATPELHHVLTHVWTKIRDDRAARAVVLTGAGRAFSAGGSFELLDEMQRDTEVRRQTLSESAELVRNMLGVEIPIVAAINGPAVGLGCTLASLCDVVVMGASSYLSDPHVKLGLVAGDGGALTWPLIMGLPQAKEHLLLGTRIDAEKALLLGLANHVVADEKVVVEAIELATRLAELPPQSVRETKRLLNAPLASAVAAKLDWALAVESASFDTVELRSNLEASRHQGAGRRSGGG
jgi:enoyl-CoA hydratase